MSDGFGSGGYGDTSGGNDGYGSGGGGGGGSEGGFIDNAKNAALGMGGVIAGALDNVPGVGMLSGWAADRVDNNQFQSGREGARVNIGRVGNVGLGFLGLATSPNPQVALSNADNLNRSINAVPANNTIRQRTGAYTRPTIAGRQRTAWERGGDFISGALSTANNLFGGATQLRQSIRNFQNPNRQDDNTPAQNLQRNNDGAGAGVGGSLYDLIPVDVRRQFQAQAERDYFNSRLGMARDTVVNNKWKTAAIGAAAVVGLYYLLKRR